MSEVIPFWQAMKLVSEGKEVEYKMSGAWFKYDKSRGMSEDAFIYEWRIKPTPVKYSVDIWLDGEPISCSNYTFKNRVIGEYITSSIIKTEKCNKHYKITVESVEE
jgi:hypothetical protein